MFNPTHRSFLSSSEGQQVLEIMEAKENWIIKLGILFWFLCIFLQYVKMIKKIAKMINQHTTKILSDPFQS